MKKPLPSHLFPLIAFLSLLGVSACGTEAAPAPAAEPPPVSTVVPTVAPSEISAVAEDGRSTSDESKPEYDLFTGDGVLANVPAITGTYQESEVAGDRQYKGKVIALSSSVHHIEESDGKVIVWIYEPYVDQPKEMACRMHATDAKEVATYIKDEHIELIGKGAGLVDGFFHMDDCVLDKNH